MLEGFINAYIFAYIACWPSPSLQVYKRVSFSQTLYAKQSLQDTNLPFWVVGLGEVVVGGGGGGEVVVGAGGGGEMIVGAGGGGEMVVGAGGGGEVVVGGEVLRGRSK